MSDHEPFDDESASPPARRHTLAVLVGVGCFTALAVSLFVFRHFHCVGNAIEEARAAGFVLDIRRTKAADAEVNRRASAFYEAVEQLSKEPLFKSLEERFLSSLRARNDPDRDLELRASLRTADALFQRFDELLPIPPIDPARIELQRSSAVSTIKMLSIASHEFIEKGDRGDAERMVVRLFEIAMALRASSDAWNARLRLDALDEASERMLEMLIAQPNPEAWSTELIRDEGAGAWHDFHEHELTRMLEATDPQLVGSTIATRSLPPIEFPNAWERLLWPERLSIFISLGAQSRQIIDSGNPDALAKVRELEKDVGKWVMPKASRPYSTQLELEFRVRSHVALVRAAARVLERLRRADFDTVDLAELAKHLPSDFETGLPFRVVREADTIVVQNVTNTRGYRVVRKDILGR